MSAETERRVHMPGGKLSTRRNWEWRPQISRPKTILTLGQGHKRINKVEKYAESMGLDNHKNFTKKSQLQ